MESTLEIFFTYIEDYSASLSLSLQGIFTDILSQNHDSIQYLLQAKNTERISLYEQHFIYICNQICKINIRQNTQLPSMKFN